jgi:hypothetical protein
MFARSISIHLKPNSVADFTQLIEKVASCSWQLGSLPGPPKWLLKDAAILTACGVGREHSE